MAARWWGGAQEQDALAPCDKGESASCLANRRFAVWVPSSDYHKACYASQEQLWGWWIKLAQVPLYRVLANARLSTPTLAEATETDKTTCRPFWDPGSLQQAVYSVRATAAAANWTLPAVVTGRRLRSVKAQVFGLTRRPPPPVSLFPCGNKPPANQVGQ